MNDSRNFRPFAPGAADYGGEMARQFSRARALSPQATEAWRDAVQRHLAGTGVRRMLDLGSGSGRFSEHLVEWLDCEVVAVEPSHVMRGEAARAAGARVRHVGGRAEAIPIADGSFDAAWMANVIHHVHDKRACAAELARTVRGGGPILVTGAFSDRLDGITLFRFFPEARRVAEGFPDVESVARLFADAGYRLGALERIRQQTCANLTEAAARTRLRADTTLRLISDEAFMNGQARIEAAALVESDPVFDELDLLRFERE